MIVKYKEKRLPNAFSPTLGKKWYLQFIRTFFNDGINQRKKIKSLGTPESFKINILYQFFD